MALAAVELLTRDLVALLSPPGAPEWGIFLDGVPVVVADSVINFDWKNDSRISDYQVEQGSFESYNKVETPYEARFRFSAGGSAARRQRLLDSVRAIAKTRDLYDVVTPEAVYLDANVTHVDYRRTSTDGVGLLKVDIGLTEVRVEAETAFGNTQTPAGASPQSGGNVSPRDATPDQDAKVPDVQ